MSMRRLSIRLFLWMMVTLLAGTSCIALAPLQPVQQPVILQPESPLSYDYSILAQNRWRLVEITYRGGIVTFPALEPISITFDLSGLLGVSVSNANGMAYQITGTGEGRHQLTLFPWIAQDCGQVWNTQHAQLRDLVGTTTTYAIRGNRLFLTGPDLYIHFEIDNSPLPVKAYSVCTEIADQEPNSMVTMYAETLGLTYEEAERRLQLQAEMSLLEGKVIEGESTYAGSWMEHTPEFGLVVAFASPDGEKLIQKYREGIVWADLVRVKQMPYTINELFAISEQVRLAAYKTGIPFAAGTNIQQAKTTFYTAYPEELRRQLEADPSIQPYLDEIEYIYEATPASPGDLQK